MKNKYTVLGLIAAIFLTAFTIFQFSSALITTDTATVTPNTYRNFQFFATTTSQTNFATSTAATSTNIATYIDSQGRNDNGAFVIAGAKKVTFYFTVGGSFGAIANATSTFSLSVSPDGINWYPFSKLVQATSTSVSNAVEQATASISNVTSTTTSVYSMDLNNETYYAVRCASWGIQGSNAGASCAASASF